MRGSRRAEFEPGVNDWTIALRRARDRGDLVDLTRTNPTQLIAPEAPLALAQALAVPGALRYEPTSLGLESARRAVAALHGGVSWERVVLSASTSEAYSWLFKLLCDPGDRVLAPVPSYPLFEHLARLEGVELVPYRLAYDGAWHVDVASLRAGMTDRVRAVLAVSPNNPTGSYLTTSELSALWQLGVPLVCDEVFASFPLDATGEPRSALDEAEGLTFVLGGLSKLAALPQHKLAWTLLGGPDAEVQRALARLEVIADTYLSVGAPVQHAVARLIELQDGTVRRLHARCRANLAALRVSLAGTSATVLHVGGGWSAVVRLPATDPDDAWARRFLASGVVVQPGWLYDFQGGAYVVLSLITPEPEWALGVDRLRRAL